MERLTHIQKYGSFFGPPDPLFDQTNKTILTISAIAFDFDFVTSDPSKSRADEIRVLIVKNKKPPRKSKESKPGGFGLPTGQLESGESMDHALARETEHETGCRAGKIAKLFVVNKHLMIDGNPVLNEIHVFLTAASYVFYKVREIDEIDNSVDPWITLRQVFEMPFAQDRNGGSKNPNGIYFSHLKRLYDAIESMVYHPEDLIEGETIKQWLEPNRKHLIAAMSDLEKAGFLDRFLPPAEIREEETSA